VTMMTLPVRSGISLTPQIGLGGKDCTRTDNAPPIWLGGELDERARENGEKEIRKRKLFGREETS
jgi:hypothetical protein